MPFWSGEKLISKMPELVSDYKEDSVDCSAYTLSVGPEVYITPSHKMPDPERHQAQFLEPTESIPIPSGQFGFVLTEESIEVPDDAMAFISMKTKTKFRGLLNASGFHVDPGFKGRLIFAVFNAGPKAVHIKRGEPLFLIWYASLDQTTNKKKVDPGYQSIPSELINGISGEIHSVRSLSDQIKDLSERFHELDKKVIKYTVVAAVISALVVGTFGFFIRDVLAGLGNAPPMVGQPVAPVNTGQNALPTPLPEQPNLGTAPTMPPKTKN